MEAQNQKAHALRRKACQGFVVLKDIRSGMDDHALMDKYRLSSRGIQDLMEKLVKAGLLAQSEVDDRMPSYDSTVDLRDVIDKLELGDPVGMTKKSTGAMLTCPVCGASHSNKIGKCPQCGFGLLLSSNRAGDRPGDGSVFRDSGRYLVVPVPVYEIRNPRLVGTVSDITDKAVGVTGIPTMIEETKTLVVAPEHSLMIQPIRFRSKCRWKDLSKPGHVARFEILEIAEKDRRSLRELIEVLTFAF